MSDRATDTSNTNRIAIALKTSSLELQALATMSTLPVYGPEAQAVAEVELKVKTGADQEV